jgi:uncharacterized DUF497 family protein
MGRAEAAMDAPRAWPRFCRRSRSVCRPTFEFEDNREDYGERRIVCVGFLRDRMVALVYVQHGSGRRIISMRKTNERERKIYKTQIGR